MDVRHGHDAEKGLHLNQIHDLNRSFEDMMPGLESWIPMYMTGQGLPCSILKGAVEQRVSAPPEGIRSRCPLR